MNAANVTLSQAETRESAPLTTEILFNLLFTTQWQESAVS